MLKTDISVLNSQFSSQNHLFFIDTVVTNFLPAILKHRCLKFPQTGPAVAQHLIAEVRFPFPICFHFHQKIEINFVVWLLMVSATIYMINSFLVLGLLVHVMPSIFFSKILRSEALVYKSYFCQNTHSPEFFRH